MTAPTLAKSVFRMSCFGCARFRRDELAPNACPVGGLPSGPLANARCKAGFQAKSKKETSSIDDTRGAGR